MATNFPSSLDTFTNPTATDTLDSPPHDQQHANINDAVEALEAKVGVNSSAVSSSLDYKVANLESRPVETKTASYTLVAGDVNKRIVMNSASATTITVDDGVFAAGDTVWIHNIGAGTTTVTAGTATVNTAGSLDVGQWEGGSLYFTSASSAIFFRGGGAVSAANFTDTETGTYSSGGTNYKYLTFNASGTITIDKAGLADVLSVAGGGGGGQRHAGGGGGGGVLELTDVYLPAGTLTVTVGGGGAGSTNTENMGSLGSASGLSLSGIPYALAVGGGGGGSRVSNGIEGGSAGGDGVTNRTGGTAALSLLVSQGSAGGGGGNTNTAGGGGGAGGAGTDGGDGNPATAGNGGAGVASTITNTSITRGGGGGGGAGSPSTAGTGTDGGGNGSGNNTVASNGTANYGGGGGGGGFSPTDGPGGNGGSGVVIVRVKV